MSENKGKRLIENQVDLMLFEEGRFCPVNWLLREGILDFDDYQSWKNGNVAFLEDLFKTPNSDILSILQVVRQYAMNLQLESYVGTYFSTAGQPLRFSHSKENERLFSNVLEPAKDRIQSDLFYDSAAVCLESDLGMAISAQSTDQIPDLLAKLQQSSPEKLERYKKLLTIENRIADAEESVDGKIALIFQATSLAFELLGRFAADYVTLLWRQLTEEIAENRYIAQTPHCHASYTAFKGLQWQRVISSIEREKDWDRHPELIFRYAEAQFKLGNEPMGTNSWLKLFNGFPANAEQQITKTCNRLLLSDWQTFSELEPELDLGLFPAWLMMHKPALADNFAITGGIGHSALQLMLSLLYSAKNGINEDLLLCRKKLQQNFPVLFSLYMRKYGQSKHTEGKRY